MASSGSFGHVSPQQHVVDRLSNYIVTFSSSRFGFGGRPDCSLCFCFSCCFFICVSVHVLVKAGAIIFSANFSADRIVLVKMRGVCGVRNATVQVASFLTTGFVCKSLMLVEPVQHSKLLESESA